MPFHVSDPADPPDYIRAERLRAANRVIDTAGFALGDEVDIVGGVSPDLKLVEPVGIVVGYLPGAIAQVAVMVSLSSGMEIVLPLLQSHVRKPA